MDGVRTRYILPPRDETLSHADAARENYLFILLHPTGLLLGAANNTNRVNTRRADVDVVALVGGLVSWATRRDPTLYSAS